MARTEFAAALNQIASERGIDPQAVLDSLKQALIAAFRKDYQSEYEKLEEKEIEPEVTLDPDTGEFRIMAEGKDITPPGFGRIAAQTAKQVIFQQVREAEKSSIIIEYQDRIGELITAQVLRMDRNDVVLDIGRGQGVMPPEEQIRGEFYRLNSRLAVVISDIRETFRGDTVICSRADSRLVKELFAREVPEVGSGAVVIKSIARDPGVRTKIAVESTQEGVDPVGSCVGQKGVRVQAVINELNGERIDIIQFSENPVSFIGAALSPAENMEIKINEQSKEANVVVPDDQLSLAIGRGGQNVKLAAKLTGYKINLVAAESKQQAQATGEEEFEIDLLDLETRVRNKLVEEGITRIEQLLGDGLERVAGVEGVGPKSVEEIRSKLAAYQTSAEAAAAARASSEATEVPQVEETEPVKESDKSTAQAE
jgi:N utilization substance protein A